MGAQTSRTYVPPDARTAATSGDAAAAAWSEVVGREPQDLLYQDLHPAVRLLAHAVGRGNGGFGLAAPVDRDLS